MLFITFMGLYIFMPIFLAINIINLAYYARRNYDHMDGTETGIRVIFSYTVNNNPKKY